MNQPQLVQTPFGVNVFGSAVVRIEPDIVLLRFAVSRTQPHPRDAFREAHAAVKDVRSYLDKAKVSDVSTSRVSIDQTFRFTNGEQKFVGYTAKVAFHVLLHQLDQMEDILSGIVDAGVNVISAVDFQTTHLKELRADARRRAIAAAREKAENYCTAAGVTLGRVIHIEDVNPDTLQSREGHVIREAPQPDDTGEVKVFDPGSITVGGVVILSFEIA